MIRWREGRRARLAVGLAVLMIALTGCWDQKEVDQLAIVLSLGVDVGEEEGSVTVTYEIAHPGGIATAQDGGPPAGGQGSFVLSAGGRSILEASQHLQRRGSRRIFLSHLRTVVFGEELAREGVARVVDYLERDGQLRRTMWIVVAEGRAREIVDVSPRIEEVAGVAFDRFVGLANRAGMVPIIFGNFLERISSPGGAAIAPILRTVSGGIQAQFVGTAVFSRDRMIGVLDERATSGLAFALGEVAPGVVVVAEDPRWTESQSVAFVLSEVKSNISTGIDGGRVRVTIDVLVRGHLLEAMGGSGLTTPDGWKALERLYANAVKTVIEEMLSEVQDWKADVLLIGERVARFHPQAWRHLEGVWPDAFAEAEITVNVTSQLRHSGLIKESIPARQGGRD